MDWDAIIGHPMLYHLNTVMNVKDNRVSMQHRRKMRYARNMLNRVREAHVMQAAATFTEDYDSPCDSPISHHSSSHAYETETVEDITDSCGDSEEEPALSHHTSDNESQGRPEAQGHQMLDETPTLHPWFDCASAEEMIAHAQPHWASYTDIDNSGIK